MGRPRLDIKQKAAVLGVSLTESDLERFNSLADLMKVSRSELFRTVLNFWIDSLRGKLPESVLNPKEGE